MANNDSRQKLIAIAAVVIILLLGVNAFLLVNNMKQKTTIEEQTVEISEAEKLKVELEKQYYEALSELEEMRGGNEELNDLIEQQKAELEESKDRIAKLIRSGKDLKRARAEINNLNVQLEQYKGEISQLKEQNQALVQRTSQLEDEKTALENTLEASQQTNEELNTARVELVNQNEELSKNNDQLSEKVSIASVVEVDDVVVTGFKSKKSGKAVSKKYAKNIDHLKVCFNTTENFVVEPGTEYFHVRIINPLGETLAVEELGSGVITNESTREQIRFTQVKEYDYNRDEKTLCLLWQPNLSFSKGNYEVEIYNKGYLSGKGDFQLK